MYFIDTDGAPNKPHAANPAIALSLRAGRSWRGVAAAERSP
jgi:hypothetical protein